MPKSKPTPEATRYREHKSLELRRKSWTFKEIGDELGLSIEGVRKAVRRAQLKDEAEAAAKSSTELSEVRRRLVQVFNLAIAEGEGRGGVQYLRLALQAAEDLGALAGHELRRPRMTDNEGSPGQVLRGTDARIWGAMASHVRAARRLERVVEKIGRRSAKPPKGKTDPIPHPTAENAS